MPNMTGSATASASAEPDRPPALVEGAGAQEMSTSSHHQYASPSGLTTPCEPCASSRKESHASTRAPASVTNKHRSQQGCRLQANGSNANVTACIMTGSCAAGTRPHVPTAVPAGEASRQLQETCHVHARPPAAPQVAPPCRLLPPQLLRPTCDASTHADLLNVQSCMMRLLLSMRVNMFGCGTKAVLFR